MSGGNYAYPPFAYTFSPDYVSATPKGSNCTIRQGSTSGSILTTNTAYIVYKGTKFYWMPSTNYSYAAGATSSTTTYKTVTINSPGTYDYSPDYAKLASVSCTRCTCDHNNSTYYTIGETITFTANTNCAFNSSGTSTTDTSKSVSAGGRPSASADWVHVTALNGTHCSTASTTGWYQYGVDISWIADTGYAFDNYNTTA